MPRFQITNIRTGVDLGTFIGDDAEDAIRALYADAGYMTPDSITALGDSADLVASQVPSYGKIATDYRLWSERMDPMGLTTEDEFDAMPVDEKVALLAQAFGPEA